MGIFSSLFELTEKNIVAVVGCGGKTSFINALAKENKTQKVLISPTTKIFPPKQDGFLVLDTLKDCLAHKAKQGIQCLGIADPKTNKLTALPSEILQTIAEDYDLVLLEADGSKGLPCKGWGEHEPVIPLYATHTVGIVSIDAIGKPANNDYVLRLQEFLDLTGLQENSIIEESNILSMICAPTGMFVKSRGKCSVFINKVESAEKERVAKNILRAINNQYPKRFSNLLYGSIHENKCYLAV